MKKKKHVTCQKAVTALMATALIFTSGIPAPALFENASSVYAEEAQVSLAGVRKLPENLISYDYLDMECRQIPNEVQKGMYFLNGTQLSFYSFDTEEVEEVCTFANAADSYVADGRLYILEYSPYAANTSIHSIQVYDLDSKTLEKSIDLTAVISTIQSERTDNNQNDENTVSIKLNVEAIGADDNGRLYLAVGFGEEAWIYLLSRDGEILSNAKAPSAVYDFTGFDSITGNFYFECYYNWIYWGYDHDTHALGAGNVTGNTVNIKDTVVQTISQSYYSNRQRAGDLLGGKYLCVDTPLYATGDLMNPMLSGLFIVDSNQTNVLDDKFSLVGYLDRSYEGDRYSSLGSRSVYHEKNHSIITYVDDETLAEFDPVTKDYTGSYQTAHPVFSMDCYQGTIVAVEKEEDAYYLEFIEWKRSDALEIYADVSTLQAGSTLQLTAKANGTIRETLTWESSDSKIVSVTSDGKVYAWHEGTADIIVKTSNGLSASYALEVTAAPKTEDIKNIQSLSGQVSNNSSNNISRSNYGAVVNSYLMENEDGTLTRVEYTNDSILVETYDRNTGNLLDTKQITMELPLFGGFYDGEDANYLVFGDANGQEEDAKEILRVVKYSKDWTRISYVSVNGANTLRPFDAGSLRMTETQGRLYIHTCHTMYKSDDGLNHQANMTYVVKEDDMQIEDSYYNVMNFTQAGYVSHSFNQFIQTDGTYVYRVDLGDAYPRAITLSRCVVGDSIQNVQGISAFKIAGTVGNNRTGVSVGDFQLSSETCLIAANSIDQEDTDSLSNVRNIFVTVADKRTFQTNTVWITDYKNDEVRVGAPHLVKFGEDQFLLMWEEYRSSTDGTVTKMVTLDGWGNRTSDIMKTSMRLSDCEPIVTSDGFVRWYQSDGSHIVMYVLNPLNLAVIGEQEKINVSGNMLGDVNADGSIDLTDVQLVLQRYLSLASEEQVPEELSDVDGNGEVDLTDVQLILQKYLDLIEEFPAVPEDDPGV